MTTIYSQYSGQIILHSLSNFVSPPDSIVRCRESYVVYSVKKPEDVPFQIDWKRLNKALVLDLGNRRA